jgi:hypothetical protein
LVLYLQLKSKLNKKLDWNMQPERLVDFHKTTQCYILEDRTLQRLCCENLKSNTLHKLFPSKEHKYDLFVFNKIQKLILSSLQLKRGPQ